MRRFALLLLLIGSVGCGSSSPSGPTMPPTANAIVTVSSFGVTVEGNPGSLVYHVTFTLNETSGRSTATITQISYNFSNGASASQTPNGVKIPAGQSYNAGTINLHDSTGAQVASSLTMTVSFTDDVSHAGSMSATASITPLQFFSLVGFVRDQSTGQNIDGATVTVTSGPNNGTSTTAHGGYYAFGALQPGTFTVQATASGHFASTQTVTLAANTEVDFSIAPTPPPAPAVEYRITGTARRCSATYQNSSGGVNQSEVGIPFSYSWPSARSGDFLYMSCQIDTGGDNGNILVQLFKNGVLVQSAQANGFPNIATVSGSY